MRFVFDTNVIVSASLFEEGKPGRSFYSAIDSGEILISNAVLKEANDVLRRKKFDRYVSLKKRKRFLRALVREARLIAVKEEISACRDPDDDKFLELAVSGGASCVVSGDDDLLMLNPFRGIAIMKPSTFLGWLPAQG